MAEKRKSLSLAPGFAHDLEFAGGQFLLAGSNAAVGISRDGSKWGFTSMEDHRFGDFSGITSDGSRIVAVGWTTYGGLRGVMAISDSGAELVPVDLREIGGLSSVDWGGGRFVAVGKDGLILTSRDGVSWTNAASPANPLVVPRGLRSPR